MIVIYIYLDSEESAEGLAVALLRQKLVAHASIDKDNATLMFIDNKILKRANYVVTGQTRALLFEKIVEFVKTRCKSDVKISSVPIVNCNQAFSEVIWSQTQSPEA